MELRQGTTYTAEEMEALEAEAKQQEKVASPKKKVAGKFHLPVLWINDASQWEVAEEMKHFTPAISEKVCVGGCCGHEGLKSACCYLDPDNLEHVLGPLKLEEEWIEDFQRWMRLKGIHLKRSDIVIDYEEGKLIGDAFFHGHDVFSSKESYPMLRFQVSGPRFACKFLSTETGRCTIYEKRPNMCRDYYCEYIKANFLVHTQAHPNRYVKLR
jgi:Fe-S-cluster containining protein